MRLITVPIILLITLLITILGSLLDSVVAYGFDASCVKTKIVHGSQCNNLLVNFNFTGCGADVPEEKTVRSSCVNRKAVAFVKTSDSLYITTYAAPIDDGGPWRYLTTRQEARKDAQKTKAIPTGVVEVSAPSIPMAPNLSIPPVPSSPNLEEEKSSVVLPAVEDPNKIIATPPIELAKPIIPEAQSSTKFEKMSKSEIKFSGLFDFYYVGNGNNPSSVTLPTPASPLPPVGNNTYRAFDQYHDTFSLALAQIGIERKIEKSNVRIELGFGGNTAVMSPDDLATQNVLQAYLKQELRSGIYLYAGKMFTHMGLETPYAIENWNYSRSLLFTYAIPLWHDGMALEFEIVPKSFSATAFLYNNWSGVYENNRMKTAGLRLAYAMNGLTLNYNFIGGSETNSSNRIRQVHEANLTWGMGDGFSFAGDYVYGVENLALNGSDVSWTVISAALKWTLNSYSLAARYEAYTDANGYTIAGHYQSTGAPLVQSPTSITLTNTFDMGPGTKTILEFRQDQSDQLAFVDMNGVPSQTQLTSTLAFLYQF